MNYKLYWELTNEGDARLLRAFGETPEPRFPAEIEGRAITEIGDYCFAAQAHLPAECRCSYVQEETEADGAPETAPDGEMQAEPETDGAPETALDGEADVMPGADGAPGAEPGADGALAELAGAYITRVTLPEGIDAKELLEQAVERHVAYVPGTHFFCDGGHENTLRLNFSNSNIAQIHEGMSTLREIFAQALAK